MTCEHLEREGGLADLDSADEHVKSCPTCRARHADYRRITQAIAGGDSAHPLPDGWRERTLARVRASATRAPRRPVRAEWRRRPVALSGVAALALAAAALAMFFLSRGGAPSRPSQPTLAVRLQEGDGEWRGEGHPGDLLQAAATSGGAAWFELRVYRESRELAFHCPGSPAPDCRAADSGVHVSWRLPSVGEYQLLWLVSSTRAPPATGDLEKDVRAARETGARVAATEWVRVR